jgi:hypothetical protein
MTMRTAALAVVLAAGRGERFGAGPPSNTDGWQPDRARMVGRAVARRASHRRGGRCAGARGPSLAPTAASEECARDDLHWRHKREHSLASALDALRGRAADRDWIVVHERRGPSLRADGSRALLDESTAIPSAASRRAGQRYAEEGCGRRTVAGHGRPGETLALR